MTYSADIDNNPDWCSEGRSVGSHLTKKITDPVPVPVPDPDSAKIANPDPDPDPVKTQTRYIPSSGGLGPKGPRGKYLRGGPNA